MARHQRAVSFERRQVVLPAGTAHHRRHSLPRQVVPRQCLGLFILVALDGVLTVAQEQVGTA